MSDHLNKPVQSRTWIQKLSMLIFYVSIIALIYLATTRQTQVIQISHGDKLQHLAAFGWLTFFAYQGWRSHFLVRFAVIFAIGAGIELAQYFIQYRSASWPDLMANAAGIILMEITIRFFARMSKKAPPE